MKNRLLFLGVLTAFLVLSCSHEMKSNQAGVLKINGTELYVEAVGEGEPIIVIHGGPVLDHGYLQAHLSGLEDNYQLIYYDQRLSGRSTGEVDSSDINIEAFLKDIDDIRQHFGYDKVHILGHSWGGLLAMEYALRYGDNVDKLLLINSIAPSYSLWEKEQTMVASEVSSKDSIRREEIMKSDLFKENPPEAIKQLLKLSFKNELSDSSLVDRLQFYIPDNYMARSQKFSQLSDYLFQYNLLEQLENLMMPTLIIYGENEPSTKISAPILQNKIKHSKLVIFENCGHFPFLEYPREFNCEVKEFLDFTEKKTKK